MALAEFFEAAAKALPYLRRYTGAGATIAAAITAGTYIPDMLPSELRFFAYRFVFFVMVIGFLAMLAHIGLDLVHRIRALRVRP